MNRQDIKDYQACLDKVIDKLIDLYHNDLSDNILDKVTSATEHKVIQRVLRHTKNNHTQSAKMLGISRTTLLKKIKKSS